MIFLYALAGLSLALAAQGVPLTKKDVGSSGYDYRPQATSYGVPSGSIGAGSQDYRISTSAPFARFEATTASPFSGFEATTASPFAGFEATTASPLPGVTGSNLQQSYATSTISPLLYNQGFQLPIHDFTSFNGGGVQTLGNAPVNGNAFGGLVFDQGADFGQQINPQLVSIGINGNQGLLNAQNLPSQIFVNGGLPQSGNLQNRYNVDEITQGTDESDDGVEPDIEVSRHLYFFSSADDIQTPRQRINLPKAPKKQNLKVLFIKAPAIVTPPPVVIPAQKQNEEKTVVYVLVKKPEEPTPIEIETPPTTPPSKPEVFFIKYNTQQEAEEAVAKIQKQQKEQNHVEGPELLSSRFSQEGPTVGINQGPALGINQGPSLGINQGASLGFNQGPSLDVSQGASLGFNQGPALDINQGSSLGFNQGSSLGITQGPPLINLAGSLTTTVSPLQFAALGQGGPLTQVTSTEAPQVVFNSPNVFSSPVLPGGNQQSSISIDSFPSTSTSSDADNVKALSESFGGPTSSHVDSDSSSSVDLSATKLGGPTSSDSSDSDSDSDSSSSASSSSNNVTPHSTYGVPDKRFIHTAYRPAPFKRTVHRFRF